MSLDYNCIFEVFFNPWSRCAGTGQSYTENCSSQQGHWARQAWAELILLWNCKVSSNTQIYIIVVHQRYSNIRCSKYSSSVPCAFTKSLPLFLLEKKKRDNKEKLKCKKSWRNLKTIYHVIMSEIPAMGGWDRKISIQRPVQDMQCHPF